MPAHAKRPLRLLARDSDDLAVISTTLQDAVGHAAEFEFSPRTRRFISRLNRFRWETAPSVLEAGERVQCVFSIDGVMSARVRGLEIADAEAVAALLAVTFEPAEKPPAGVVRLAFCGCGEIELEVECLDATLIDLSEPWPARGRPMHVG